MKHILCVIGQLGNGGSEKQLYLFLSHLDKSRFSASLFVTSPKDGIWAKRIERDLDVEIVDCGKLSIMSKIAVYWRTLKKTKPDVVFSWSFFTNPLVFCTFGAEFVGSLRNQYSEELELSGNFRSRLCFAPRKIVVNSSFLLEELLEAGVRESKIKPVFNIFQNDASEADEAEKRRRKFSVEHGLGEDELIVMAVGRDSKGKNFPFFVDAVVKARERNSKIHGVLIGSGCDGVREFVEKRGLSDFMTLTGEIPNARIYLPLADVFFLSSIREGMPNVLLEAVAAGCAPLATDVGGVRDIFSEIPDCLLDKVLLDSFDDVDAAADKLLELARNENLRETINRHAGKFLDRLTPEKIMREYYKILFDD